MPETVIWSPFDVVPKAENGYSSGFTYSLKDTAGTRDSPEERVPPENVMLIPPCVYPHGLGVLTIINRLPISSSN